eukprot:scaffold311753_cov27-Tisochrysis_lutea.AAC.1
MPAFDPTPHAPGTHQVFMYAARNLEATAATNVSFHLKRRIRKHVFREWRLEQGEYYALTQEQRKERNRDLLLVCLDPRVYVNTR